MLVYEKVALTELGNVFELRGVDERIMKKWLVYFDIRR
jgi:hypothetical protein